MRWEPRLKPHRGRRQAAILPAAQTFFDLMEHAVPTRGIWTGDSLRFQPAALSLPRPVGLCPTAVSHEGRLASLPLSRYLWRPAGCPCPVPPSWLLAPAQKNQLQSVLVEAFLDGTELLMPLQGPGVLVLLVKAYPPTGTMNVCLV